MNKQDKKGLSMAYFGAIIGIIIFLIIPMASASIDKIPTVKQNNCVNLPQTNLNVTIEMITFVQLPDGTRDNVYLGMNNTGNGTWSYNYCNTNQLGEYNVNGRNEVDSWNYYFEVTPSGNPSTGTNVGLFIIMAIILYSIAFIGFFGRSEWVTIIGGLGMIALGLYSINSGVIIYKDFITNVFSWTTIGLGAFFSLFAGINIIQENL